MAENEDVAWFPLPITIVKIPSELVMAWCVSVYTETGLDVPLMISACIKTVRLGAILPLASRAID